MAGLVVLALHGLGLTVAVVVTTPTQRWLG